MNSYGNLFYMIYNAFSLQLVNTQTLVDKQVKPGYTTCKEAVNGQITTILMGNYSMNRLGIPL